ncbi:MAG: hypothetical protein LC689_17190 [Myxococcales bacterium]|nr:hypothetical protein [Myxococcales bacterium]
MSRTAFAAAAVSVASILACARGPASTDESLLLTSKAVDPGPRGGAPGAGGPLAGLGHDEVQFFNDGRDRFMEVDSVSGAISGEEGRGLGPRFNANSCASCHAEPAIGGSSPHPTLGFTKAPNPQLAFAALDRLPGKNQVVPSFLQRDGPVREARFILNPDGTPDGGVHALFTIAGRIDAPECALAQPDFARELARSNLIFRIPTPIFGAGLLENISDSSLQEYFAAGAAARKALGIRGRFNHSGNDGTITRFGWKAQNKSLLVFSGEAYNVEQGVTSEVFASERATAPGCNLNPTPEDTTQLRTHGGSLTGTAAEMSGDVIGFAAFARLLAPPVATTSSASELRGARVFTSVGCALCHTPTMVTDASSYTGQGGVTFHPYSDLALHHMGPGLADHVSQGAAGPDEFRSAPLWGLGQRIFFLHDGRAGPRNGGLVAAIAAHASSCGADQPVMDDGVACGSEANAAIRRYNALTTSDQQDLVNFLRSL